MDPSCHSVASSFHMERGLIIHHQWLNQHLIITSLSLLWKALFKDHFYVFSHIIKNGCYLLMISLISFFNAALDMLCSRMSDIVYAGLCPWLRRLVRFLNQIVVIILRYTVISSLKLSSQYISDSSWMNCDDHNSCCLERCCMFKSNCKWDSTIWILYFYKYLFFPFARRMK